MRTPKNVSGHFASLWVPNGATLIPTTVTTQRKSYARENEARKRLKLITELKSLTNDQEYPIVARQFDEVTRRWRGVKNHGSDG
jgi:hypothetical protein